FLTDVHAVVSAADDVYVYLAVSGTGWMDAILRCSANGCNNAPGIIAKPSAAQHDIGIIRVTSGTLYWTEIEDNTGRPTGIVRCSAMGCSTAELVVAAAVNAFDVDANNVYYVDDVS